MMYDSEIQSLVTFAQYWYYFSFPRSLFIMFVFILRRDPYDLPTYLEKSIFLADINNARTEKNSTYKKNIMSLNAFVRFNSNTKFSYFFFNFQVSFTR